MLVIRQAQMSAFERSSWEQLVRDGVSHVRLYFPEQAEALGEPTLTTHSDTVLRKASGYGVQLTYDFLRYLNVAIIFGWDFDKNQPWAAEILARREFDGRTRIDMLVEAAQDLLRYSPEASQAITGQTPAEEEDRPAEDGLADEAMGESIDADAPEPLQWEPEEAPPAWERDPDVDYAAHQSDFHDG